MKYKILIVEDNPYFLDNLVRAVAPSDKICEVLEASSVKTAFEQISSNVIDILLADVSLPDGTGFDVIKYFASKNPNGIIIVISVLSNSSTIFEAIKLGAVGYLQKDDHEMEILKSVELALEGKSPISASISRKILEFTRSIDGIQDAELKNPLTARETDILQLLAKGLTAVEVGDALNISTNTVQAHAQSIYKKLGATNKSEAIYEANSIGLIKW